MAEEIKLKVTEVSVEMWGMNLLSHMTLSAFFPPKRTVFILCAYVCVVYVICVPTEVRRDQLEAGNIMQVDQEEGILVQSGARI